MKKIIAIPGSNSSESINKNLASFVANQINNAEVELINLNDYQLPIYGVDEEELRGIPLDAKKLDNAIDSADAIVISLAEHNGSYSVAFKNVVDWLSRINMQVWKEKPMLLVATSPGERGGKTVLEAAKSYFPYLGGNIVDTYALPSFYDNFKEGSVVNIEIEARIQSMVNKLEATI